MILILRSHCTSPVRATDIVSNLESSGKQKMFSGYRVFVCARQEATCNLWDGGLLALGWRSAHGRHCGISWEGVIAELTRHTHTSGTMSQSLASLLLASEGRTWGYLIGTDALYWEVHSKTRSWTAVSCWCLINREGGF